MKIKKNELKTPEEHLQYLEDSIKLMLWFCHYWAMEHPDEDFIYTLEERVDIFCKTDLNKGGLYDWNRPEGDPEWKELMQKVVEIKNSLGPEEHDKFEAKAFEIIKPRIKGRVERDMKDLHSEEFRKHAENGPFWFDKEFINVPEQPKCINFHIYNSCYPGSIFDEPDYLPKFFLRMMNKAEEELGAERLSTLTWMNNLNRWINIFPPEYKAGLSEPDGDIRGHLGFWGQVITSRHTLSKVFDVRIRQTGHIPYLMKRAYCTFKSMRDYLKKEFGV